MELILPAHHMIWDTIYAGNFQVYGIIWYLCCIFLLSAVWIRISILPFTTINCLYLSRVKIHVYRDIFELFQIANLRERFT